MNKKIVALTGAILLLVVIGVVAILSQESTSQTLKRTPKFVSSRWDQDFVLTDANPLGLKLFKTLAESEASNAFIIEDSLENFRTDSLSTYIFVGDQFSIYNSEFDSILVDVQKGSTLLLAFNDLSENIHKQFFHDIYNEWYFDDNVLVHEENRPKSYGLYSLFQTDTIAQKWQIFREDNVIDSTFESLSYFMETPNFIKVKVGKGAIFLHANPSFFYNYQLLSKDGYNHALFVLHQFPHKTIKWLELGRLRDDIGTFDTDQTSGNKGRKDDSLLQFLFQKKELICALLLTIFGIILYLIFRTKRYWPIIPYLPLTQNRSLDFAETMSAIYLKQDSPYSILIVMRKNFRNMVNKHYFIDLSKGELAAMIQLLSEKTGVELAQVDKLVRMLENEKMRAVTYEFVQEVAQLQRMFYEKTNSIKANVSAKSKAKKIVLKRQLFVPIGLVLSGILTIFRSFFLLSLAKESGPIVLVIGGIILGLGITVFNRKFIEIEARQFLFYPYFGKRKSFDLDELIEVRVQANRNVKLLFTGNRTITINTLDLSRYSRNDFEQFIAPFVALN